MHVLTVVGARPQFIKAAVVSIALAKRHEVRHTLAHTGQHYDPSMSDVFFDELDIPRPDMSLEIGSGLHGEQTGRMLAALEQVMLDQDPDVVLVYGDTNSTLAGALAAAKLHIPVAHVEAGLRSFNRRMPEEINRVLTDHISSIHFAPTAAAVENLAAEGIKEEVHQVGDVMYDAMRHFGHAASSHHPSHLATLGLAGERFVLATVHRAENTDDPHRLSCIVQALGEVADDLPVLFPVHPRTRAALSRLDLSLPAGLIATAPLGYLEMLSAEASAAVVVTDSGGVQKEAYFHGVPCVTLRDETEWIELVESGWNQVVPPTTAAVIVAAVRGAVGRVGRPITAYGSGDAAERIVDRLLAG